MRISFTWQTPVPVSNVPLLQLQTVPDNILPETQVEQSFKVIPVQLLQVVWHDWHAEEISIVPTLQGQVV